MFKQAILFIILICMHLGVKAQSEDNKFDLSKSFYIYWGYNRGYYTNSNIHMTGEGYDFTLDKVKAKDRQSSFNLRNYVFITSLTVPQTNLKAGYQLSDKYSVALGFDHMKYVVEQNQTTNINGHIHLNDSRYNGEYHNQEIILEKSFLSYEHTDGLNYVFLELNRHDRLIKRNKIQLSTIFGLSPAFLRPRTDVAFLGVEGPNVYHFAGYGINAKAGLNLLLWNHFSIMSEIKGGYINLPDVRATTNAHEKAQQHFGFLQTNLQFGYIFKFK